MITTPRRYRFVVQDRDRHGNLRTYLRRPGQPKVRLHETPGTDAFDAEYRAAMAAEPAPPPKRRSAPAAGTVDALVVAYYASSEFRTGLGPRSQQVRRLVLDRFRAAKGRDGKAHGERDAGTLPAPFLERLKDEKAETPESFNALLKALRAAYTAGVRLGLLQTNPAAQVAYLRGGNPDGWHTWTPAEIAQFLARHPVGTKPALALAILYCLGVRRSNAVLLGPPHVREGGVVEFRPVKGSRRSPKLLRLPMPDDLAAVLAATPHGRMTWLESERGGPYTAESFGNSFRRWCREAGLPHCGPHGLRKARAVERAHAGASDREMMALFGWSSAKEPVRYTRAAEQGRLAAAALRRGEVSHSGPSAEKWDENDPQDADLTVGKNVMVPRAGLRKAR